MPVVVFVETTDNNRGRFLAASSSDAISILSRYYPVGASVAKKLTRGDKVSTDSYTLQIHLLETAPPKQQQTLF